MSVVPQSGGHCGPLHEEHSQLSQVARLTQTFLGLDLEVYRECGFRVGGGCPERTRGSERGRGSLGGEEWGGGGGEVREEDEAQRMWWFRERLNGRGTERREMGVKREQCCLRGEGASEKLREMGLQREGRGFREGDEGLVLWSGAWGAAGQSFPS